MPGNPALLNDALSDPPRKRLLDAGLVEEAGERADPDTGDERRRYYRLTRRGRSAANAEAERLAALLRDDRVRRLLKRRRAAQEGA